VAPSRVRARVLPRLRGADREQGHPRLKGRLRLFCGYATGQLRRIMRLVENNPEHDREMEALTRRSSTAGAWSGCTDSATTLATPTGTGPSRSSGNASTTCVVPRVHGERGGETPRGSAKT